MSAYYNEIDPFMAAWLRELIKAGCIPAGIVDERSIEDVTPAELESYDQCHFFAGAGGWPRALRLSGWSDNQPVWTGSAPCQPFSTAGKSKGFADERHLWPAFFWLITQCRPVTIFGEQVASTHGLRWFDLVSSDLEGEGYTCGAINLSAAGYGAVHIRQRLFWGATYTNCERLQAWDEPKTIREENEVEAAWREFERIHAEGHWKKGPAEPRIYPFADGIPNRVGQVRGYGNAIVPQVAAEFMNAFEELIA